MSLYDDDDDIIEKADPTGWAKPKITPAGPFKPMATAASPAISPAVAGLNRPKPLGAAPKSLPPVINLQKPKRPSSATPFQYSPVVGKGSSAGVSKVVDYDDVPPPTKTFTYGGSGDKYSDSSRLPLKDPNWTPVNEYDPLWPNDYHKVAGEIREARRKQRAAERAAAVDEEEAEEKRRRYSDGGKEKGREMASGFGMRPKGFGADDYSDDEEDNTRSGGGSDGRGRGGGGGGGSGGAAIAPPPSLTASSSPPPPEAGPQLPASMKKPAVKSTGLGFAAKIMAKYGYREGQGLGRDEQGMSTALSVEKTSKRGGRIVHEKDLMPPPAFAMAAPPPNPETDLTPPHVAPDQEGAADEYGGGEYGGAPSAEPGDSNEYGSMPPPTATEDKPKPSITDLMRNPSKVVLCKNMVGPGEVDAELEPEIKEECSGKYGEVSKVVIFEIPGAPDHEAVRIFVEFGRVEAAIKALIDLNGRFFGGREVQASFYDVDKFSKYQLND